MPYVVGVRFGRATKIYFFDPAEFAELLAGDRVIVDTARGTEMGLVARPPHHVPDSEIVGNLKPVIRRATPWDLVQAESFARQERDALAVCKRLVQEQNLSMKLVRAEYSFDGSRLTFFFTSEKRVDFRNLVRDLAKEFHTRIELRQIGVRDEAKLIGGLGCCGRPLCCDTWLCDFNPVSIKMAKQQDLPLNPMEISGICGRLLCCLAYENDFYAEVKQRLPKVGKLVTTPEGRGKVIGHSVFRETVKVLLENEAIIEVSADVFGDARNERPAPGDMSEEDEPLEEVSAPIAEPAARAPAEKIPEPAAQRSKRKRKRRRKPAGPGVEQPRSAHEDADEDA